MSAASDLKYKRILLKLSGEQLMGDQSFGIDPVFLDKMANNIRELVELGVEVGLVIGGGNIYRGAALSKAGMDRVTGDHMGMLATVMNGLAMMDALHRTGVACTLMSAFGMAGVAEQYDSRKAKALLSQKEVVIFSAGTGNPFFTTDTAACLRGIEVDVDLVLKATKVDGVYNADPVKNPSATRYSSISYDQVLAEKLGVMDLTAICLCQDHKMPLRVFKMDKPGALISIVKGADEGTLIFEEVNNA